MITMTQLIWETIYINHYTKTIYYQTTMRYGSGVVVTTNCFN